MLHFGGGSSGRTTKSYQAGPGRRKVFYAVALVGLTALAIKAALDPQTWNWPAPAAHQGPDDTVLRQAGAEERMEGEFHSPAPAGNSQPPTRQLFPGVRQEYLVEVRDDTFFRSPENNAFFHLFQILENADEDQLRQASAGTVTFAQLHNQPAAYRGEVVTLRGRLRQLQRVSAARNEYDVDDYYQATLQPDDNPTFPVLVDVRHLPPGFPSQLELSADNQTARQGVPGVLGVSRRQT